MKLLVRVTVVRQSITLVVPWTFIIHLVSLPPCSASVQVWVGGDRTKGITYIVNLHHKIFVSSFILNLKLNIRQHKDFIL